jgi:hypothetical protein
MQARRNMIIIDRSLEALDSRQRDREGLIHSYDGENGGFGLTDLTEDSGGEGDERRQSFQTSINHQRPSEGYDR